MKNIGFIINKSKDKASLFFFGFAIIVLIFIALTLLGQMYVNEKISAEWNYVELAFEQGIEESISMNNELVSEIEERVRETYDDEAKLLDDLQNIEMVNDLTIILDESVTDVYLMDIQNDNNDPFIMNRQRIITDKSFNCSADMGSTRTFEEEVYLAGGDGHFSKTIAQKAIDSIVYRDNKTVIWSFLKVDPSLPWYDEVRDLEYVDMTVLRDLFFKYNGDIRVLESFEFLTPDYIYRHEDLLGTKTVNELGRKNTNNYQLIVVQGFNVVDLINELGYDKNMDVYCKEVDSFIITLRITMALIMAIMFAFFFIISRAYNKELKATNK